MVGVAKAQKLFIEVESEMYSDGLEHSVCVWTKTHAGAQGSVITPRFNERRHAVALASFLTEHYRAEGHIVSRGHPRG